MPLYTKAGPFTDGSANPGISAGFLNNVETALVTLPTAVSGLNVTSAASFTFAVPSFSGGVLTIYGTMGGAWSSVWSGVYAADSARVTVAQIVTTFTTPAQLITSVTGSTTSTVITVATAASGGTAVFGYTVLRAGGG